MNSLHNQLLASVCRPLLTAAAYRAHSRGAKAAALAIMAAAKQGITK